MPRSTKLVRAAPYATLLAASAFLYYRATHFEFTRVAERIGPDAWPRMILVLLMAICAWQIGRLVFGSPAAALQGIAPSLDDDPGGSAAEESPPSVGRVLIGIALTFGFLLAFQAVGFFASSFVYLVALMWVGGYRRMLRALAVSLAVSVSFMFIFMKIVYVSLPLGRGPFLELSIAVMRLLGIH